MKNINPAVRNSSVLSNGQLKAAWNFYRLGLLEDAESICQEFEMFLSEEKAIEVFNDFRIKHKHEKRFRSGPRWFSIRSLGIIHYQVKRVSEWNLKGLRGENEYM